MTKSNVIQHFNAELIMKELSIYELDMVSGGFSGGFSVFGMSSTASAMTVNATMSASTYTIGAIITGNRPTVGGVLGNAAAGAAFGAKTNVGSWENIKAVNGMGALAAGIEAIYNYGANKLEAALDGTGVN